MSADFAPTQEWPLNDQLLALRACLISNVYFHPFPRLVFTKGCLVVFGQKSAFFCQARNSRFLCVNLSFLKEQITTIFNNIYLFLNHLEDVSS